jgi:hypothetical protein
LTLSSPNDLQFNKYLKKSESVVSIADCIEHVLQQFRVSVISSQFSAHKLTPKTGGCESLSMAMKVAKYMESIAIDDRRSD